MENENQIINSCPKRFPYDMKENREIQIPFPVKMTDKGPLFGRPV